MKKEIPKGLYAITAENLSNGRDNIDVVKQMLDGGVKLLQYRDKQKSKIEKYHQCEIIRKLTRDCGAFFVVNDDIDIAMAVESDGVHLGQDDLPISEARKIVGAKMVVGLSTHSPKQAKKAQDDGADYIGVGPIFRTFTKTDAVEPVGLEYLKYCVENITIPKVAIGGIKIANLPSVAKFNPDNICLVSEITASPDIKKTIAQILSLIEPPARFPR
ncbi:MAG: thiamine phosphate synthase [Elusimicrobiota bacterium]|jgi:thiamine-phosphate pyrophosphorylase|nr:thiamine phosphate synthase [Elusimicrobiota bacterium]